jgi:divalent metal cation (Fe/Co/Zn/Cd) transporter
MPPAANRHLSYGKPEGDPVRAALIVSWVSIGWSACIGVTSIGVGLAVASLALLGAGAGVLIDLSSSAVLVWRFRHHGRHPAAERIAHRFAALALLSLSAFLVASGAHRLLDHGTAHPSGISLGVAAASLLVLPPIAAAKYVIARRVPSSALRADGHITVVGAVTALFALAGLAVTRWGFASADTTAALVVGLVTGIVGLSELRGRL